jgi:septal ring-binding cell division protein DamX
MSPRAESSSRDTRPSGGTASGDPSGGRVSSRENASGPIRASSTPLTSLCCHCPISTCRTLNAATECHGCHASTRSRNGSGSAPSATAAFTPSAYASNAARSRGDIAATSASAAAASRSRRASTSPATAAAPATSAHRPHARRRS